MSIFIGILILCMFLCLYRVGKGPTAPDRIVPIDIMGILMVGFCALYSITTKKDLYMNIGISWALLNFIGALALAKYLEGRGFDE
jgi:multicomponent Na+:H+ antiporter subunit F